MPPSTTIAGGRERKKVRTRRDLADAARRLTFEHGLDAVTIQQIVEEADVSCRTFFNYFTCKEEAVVGVDPGLVVEIAEAVVARPAAELPFVALSRALLELAGTPDAAEGWVQRTELVARHPALLPRHLTAMADVEQALTAAVAARMGTSISSDPRPVVMVAAAVAVLRATFSWWMRSDRREPLEAVLADGFAALSNGFATTSSTPRRREPR